MESDSAPRRFPDSDDDRWLVIRGRRWRRTDPELDEPVVDELKSHLGRARNEVKSVKKSGTAEQLRAVRSRVNTAKHGLGERGEYWWEMSLSDRRTRAEEALRELRSQQET